MSLHKLTAGDGYTYLTRQVAAGDSTERGYTSLGDYYAAKGESPGVWIGRGLAGLTVAGHQVTGQVTEQQMLNLFGAGVHPDAQLVAAKMIAAGFAAPAAAAPGKLGAKFPEISVTTGWRDALAAGYRQYADDHGLAASRLSDQDREVVRTAVADRLFTELHGRQPSGSAERSGFIAQQSRPDRTAVAGYDVTFSPVKSVSTLWAVAPRDVSEQLESAHRAAVEQTTAWIETEAGYTRVGARGVGQVDTRGLIMAAFTHRDSRAGDPDLHTHVAVSNKVQTGDGRWLSLDARMLYRVTVGASEFYNTQLEIEVRQRLGVTFADRPTEPGKRAVREIVGVDDRLNQRWSTRRAKITTTRTELAAKFLTEHGRVPTTIEMVKLAQTATLATRNPKHEPRSLGEQRQAWHDQAVQVLGGDTALARMLDQVTGRHPHPAAPAATTPTPDTTIPPAAMTPASILPVGVAVEVSRGLVTDLAHRVVAAVSAGRAVWRETNLDAEARRQVRSTGVDPAVMQDLATAVTQRAAGLEHSIPTGICNSPWPRPGPGRPR